MNVIVGIINIILGSLNVYVFIKFGGYDHLLVGCLGLFFGTFSVTNRLLKLI